MPSQPSHLLDDTKSRRVGIDFQMFAAILIKMQQVIYSHKLTVYQPFTMEFEFNIWHIGMENTPSYLLGITGRRDYKVIFETSCELKSGHQSFSLPPYNASSPIPAPIDFNAMLDLFDKAMGLRKQDSVWLPKIAQGDTILVDRAGASEVKVLDPAEQAYEKVPKRALTVEKADCSCSMRHILVHGCPRLKGGNCVTN